MLQGLRSLQEFMARRPLPPRPIGGLEAVGGGIMRALPIAIQQAQQVQMQKTQSLRQAFQLGLSSNQAPVAADELSKRLFKFNKQNLIESLAEQKSSEVNRLSMLLKTKDTPENQEALDRASKDIDLFERMRKSKKLSDRIKLNQLLRPEAMRQAKQALDQNALIKLGGRGDGRGAITEAQKVTALRTQINSALNTLSGRFQTPKERARIQRFAIDHSTWVTGRGWQLELPSDIKNEQLTQIFTNIMNLPQYVEYKTKYEKAKDKDKELENFTRYWMENKATTNFSEFNRAIETLYPGPQNTAIRESILLGIRGE